MGQTILILLQFLVFYIPCHNVSVVRRGIECYQCGGPSSLCSDTFQEESISCFTNVTTCSVAKLQDQRSKQVAFHIQIRKLSNM